jgi:predicted DNA-binding protein with PD1-like motif
MNLKYFENIDLSNVLIVRLKSMEDIRTKLLEVISENRFKRAVILSAIGSVYDAIFYGVKQNSKLPYNQDQITIMKKKGPFEVLTMEGNILPMKEQFIPHIHVTLGMHDGAVIGGHLETATVYTTIELLLAEIQKSSVVKQKDKTSGGMQIKLPIGDK